MQKGIHDRRAPVFVQRAGVVALKEGEPVIARILARLRKARDFLVHDLNAIDGISDSLEFCTRLASNACAAQWCGPMTRCTNSVP